MKKIFWIVGNFYGKMFGWNFLSGFHHAMINLSLHALGYGNAYRDSFSGEIWFIKKILSPSNPRVIIDVGANVGNYSKKLLEETSAKIYALEPNPASYEKLTHLPERVSKFNLAISDYDGEGVLNFRSSYDERATLDKDISLSYSETVKVSTLKTLIAENNIVDIDFIKIDTEGFEKEVLKGLGEVRPKFIQFEFNINHLQRHITLLELTQLLKNYDFYRLLPNGWIKISPDKFLNNIFMFSNIVAKRKD